MQTCRTNISESVRQQKDAMRRRLADLESTLTELYDISGLLDAMLSCSDDALCAVTPDRHPAMPLYEAANTLSVRCPELSTVHLIRPCLSVTRYLVTLPDISTRWNDVYGKGGDARRTLSGILHRLTELGESADRHEEPVHPFMDIIAVLQALAPEKTRELAAALLDVCRRCIAQTEISIHNYRGLAL